MLNKDLYEKYLQKKAKKLGVSVETLKTGTPQQPIQDNINSIYAQTNIIENNITNNKPEEIEINDKRENKFALIGYPLGHSLSGVIHDAGFKSSGIEATYDILETAPEDLVERLKMLKNSNYKGFNVTIPLKLPVALFVEEVDESADIASAINTVLINPDRTLKGYNTDVMGFKKALPEDINLTGKTAGILGTGGASRAAAVALAQSGIKYIRFYTRNIPNSLDLLNYMRRVFPNVEFDTFQIDQIRDLSMLDILVNTTPIGMLGHSADMTPVEKTQLTTLPEHALVYDVIYNPKKTVLLKLAQDLGYKTVNGIDMLINQAAAAEEIWTGKTPDIEKIKIAMLEKL